MNDLYDLMESASLHEVRCEGCGEKFPQISNEETCKECDESNAFGVGVAITSLEQVRDVKECHYLPNGLRKVILWEDGKEYEVVIKPLNNNGHK